jgi:hypothetical protein
MIDMQFDLNAKLEEIRAMKASNAEKNELSGMVAGEYAKAFMNTVDAPKTKKSREPWTDEDVMTVYNTIAKKYGDKDSWDYGLIKSDEFDASVSSMTESLDRTNGGIRSIIKIGTHSGNLSPSKKDKGAIGTALRYKRLAQNVGLLTEKAFVGSLYCGYTNDTVTLDEFATSVISIVDKESKTTETIDAVVTDGSVVAKHVVKVSVKNDNDKVFEKKKKSIVHRVLGARYTFDERVGIFKKVVSKLGNYQELESVYGKTSFSGFPPTDLSQTYANIASTVPNRTTSAIKNSVDHAVSVSRNPNHKYTKSRMEIYDAAVEAGFIV